MGFFIYKLYNDKEKTINNVEELNSKVSSLENIIETLETKNDKIYNEKNTNNAIEVDKKDGTIDYFEILESKFEDVKYRTDIDGTSGFVIDNGKVFHGSSVDDHFDEEVTGILEEAKYVVPLNKQDARAIVNIPGVKEHLFLTKNGYLVNLNESIYIDLNKM